MGCVHIRGATVRVEICNLFFGKQKVAASSSHYGLFVPISTFLLCLVSEVVSGEECTHFWYVLAYFCQFLANSDTIKKLFQKI